MGQTGSKVVNKIASSFSFSGDSNGSATNPFSLDDVDEAIQAIQAVQGEEVKRTTAKFGGKIPLVYSRRGSMYFDEDGDVAHEFYEEVYRRGVLKMKKVQAKRLVPQGEVEYPHPRLHVDFPIVMFEG